MLHPSDTLSRTVTVFRGFMPPETVRRLREACDPLFARIFENERHRDNTLARDVIGGHDGWQLRADGGSPQIALGTELMAACLAAYRLSSFSSSSCSTDAGCQRFNGFNF